jgi:hypothetical protein
MFGAGVRVFEGKCMFGMGLFKKKRRDVSMIWGCVFFILLPFVLLFVFFIFFFFTILALPFFHPEYSPLLVYDV